MKRATRRFENLTRAYAAELYRYAYWLCGDAARAEKLVQQTFVCAWNTLEKWRDARSARLRLYSLLRQRCLGRDEAQPPPAPTLDLPDLPVALDHPDPDFLALRQALLTLPMAYREPLVLQMLGGFTCGEIAEITHDTPERIATRLFRARRKLRDYLIRSPQSVARKG